MGDYLYNDNGDVIGDSFDYGKLMYRKGQQNIIRRILKLIPKGSDIHSMVNVWQLREHIKSLLRKPK